MFVYPLNFISTIDTGFPASDSFSGIGTDSSIVGGTNWNKRWVDTSNAVPPNLTVSISGGGLTLGVVGDGSPVAKYAFVTENKFTAVAGDFTLSGNTSNMVLDPPTGSPGASDEEMGMSVTFGGTSYNLVYLYQWAVGYFKAVWTGSGYVQTATTMPTSSTWLISRTSGTISFILNGVLVHTIANSNDLTSFSLWGSRRYDFEDTIQTWDNITLLDSEGSPVLIPE